MDGFITKPVGIEQLKATLDVWLKDAAGSAGGMSQAYDRDRLVELFGDDPRTLAEVEREFLDTARGAEREIAGTDDLQRHRARGPSAEGRVGHDRRATPCAEVAERRRAGGQGRRPAGCAPAGTRASATR